MKSQLTDNFLYCSSCLRSNEADMNFCMFCGTGLKPNVEQLRVTDLSGLRPCLKCGKPDELTKDFCIFCGTRTEVPVAQSRESQAFKKFSVELEKIEHVEAIKQEIMPTPQLKPPKTRRRGFNWTLVLGTFGVICGALSSYFLGQQTLQKIYLQLSWPKDAIVVYVEPQTVSYILQDEAGKKYLMGKSASNGSFALKNVAPGNYKLKISAPGFNTILQSVQVKKDCTSVVGYPNRLRLPTKKSS